MSASELEARQLLKLSDSIYFYCSIVGFPLGILLNLISFYAFSRRNLNRTNMGILYMWQTAVDTFLLFISALFIGLSFGLGIRLETTSDLWCRLLSLLRRFAVHASSWMSIFITFDRFLFINFPLGLSQPRQNRKRRLSALITIMFACIILINSANLLFSLEEIEIRQNNLTIVQRRCMPTPLVAVVSDTISILMRTYIPFGVMLALDILILLRLRVLKRGVGAITQREISFTFTVLASDCIFLLFNLPLSIAYITSSVHKLQGVQLEPVTDARFQFASRMAVLFAFVVQCFSFAGHLIFNRLFRQEVSRIYFN
nr:G protein-coupled receptor [Proales similis]